MLPFTVVGNSLKKSRSFQVEDFFQSNNTLVLKCSGFINEEFNLQNFVFNKGEVKFLVLDLSQIASISSFGVKQWINQLNEFAKKNIEVFFLNASSRLLDQFNMVVGFAGHGKLLSFYLNYYCDNCDTETLAYFDAFLHQQYFEDLNCPNKFCHQCYESTELDDDPEMVFEFIKYQEPVRIPLEVSRVLKQVGFLKQIPINNLDISIDPVIKDGQKISKIFLKGFLSKQLQTNKIVDSLEGKYQLDLKRLSDFDEFGFSELITLFQHGIAKSGHRVSISGLPIFLLNPLFSKRDEVLGLSIQSLAYQFLCKHCHFNNKYEVPNSLLKEFHANSKNCKKCKQDLEIRIPVSQLLEKINTLNKSVIKPLAIKKSGSFRRRRTLTNIAKEETQLFDNKYEVLCGLGEGGMAKVILARSHGAMGFKQLVVIKKANQELTNDERMVRLFLDEAKLASKLNHPNIIKVLDLGRESQGFYIVLEYLHGRSLGDLVKRLLANNETVPPILAAQIIADLCKALAFAHQPNSQGKNLVHRDITLGNVVVTFDGIVKLVDFGLAAHDQVELDAGTILGSPAWLAPEIYNGSKAHPGADIWGAGLLLVLLIRGTHPFSSKDVKSTVTNILKMPLKRGWNDKIPKNLFRIVDLALKKDPKERIQIATEFEKMLRQEIIAMGGQSSTTQLSDYIKEMFKDDLNLENNFTQIQNGANFIDALLKSKQPEVAKFFKK